MMKARLHAILVSIVAVLTVASAGADAGVLPTKVSGRVREALRSGGPRHRVLVLTTSLRTLRGTGVSSAAVRKDLPRAMSVTATAAEIQKMARSADVIAVLPDEPPQVPPVPGPQVNRGIGEFTASKVPLPDTWFASDVVGARAAWKLGYTGRGVKVAVIDERIDFCHPDLQGTAARVEDPSSPYHGWPMAFDPHSMARYAATGRTATTAYATTRSTVTEANPVYVGQALKLPQTSKSGVYHIGAHPTYWLRFTDPWGHSPYVLVADEQTAGVYDTVYVDLNKDYDFTDEKACRKGDELSWHDLDGDGLADLSGGMVYFIADGVRPIPASDWLYNLAPPANASLVCFTGAFEKYESHGTLVASAIAAQGVVGVGEPEFRTDGEGVVRGMAPDARLISIGNAYGSAASMYDAILFAVLGYDGKPNTGDEADIANLSFGYSNVMNDGWDYLARYITYLNATQAPRTTFVAATGNGGPGYGTVTSPGSSPSVISVGASTLYGSVPVFDDIASADQILWGDIQPWSNRGPSTLGLCEPDVVAVGAWATGATPLGGDGSLAWGVWGGTSLACPVACGVLAAVYQAYTEQHGARPTCETARRLLMSGADDLGYPVLEQGAGQVNAERSVRLAQGRGFSASPTSWQAGQVYPGAAGTVAQGRRASQTFSVTNAGDRLVRVQATPETFSKTGEFTFVVHANHSLETPEMPGPSHIVALTPMVPAGTDFLRVRAVVPYGQVTTVSPYSINRSFENGWSLVLYDWTDLNGNNVLWHDDVLPNGVVNQDELDPQEISRFAYDAPAADCMEVSVKQPLARIHDGLFLGLQHTKVSESIPSTDITVTLEFYRRSDWDMVQVRPARFSLPPGRTGTFRAMFDTSLDTKPGVYSGAIRVTADDGAEQTIPVTGCVSNAPESAPGGTLTVWGSDQLHAPYDNGLIRGAADWGWRPDTGDWRAYFFSPPTGLGSGARLLANVNWQHKPTDVDIQLFGPDAGDYFSTQLPALFGPCSLAPLGGSVQTNLGGAVWPFHTNTGEASEWVSAPLAQGQGPLDANRHLALLHCVLSAGVSHSETMSANVGPATVEPSELRVPAGGPSASGITLIPYLYLWQGVEARAFGFSTPTVLPDEPVSFDPSGHPEASKWFRDIVLSNAGLLEITTGSSHKIDIDLYVLRDANGDGYFDWSTELVTFSGDTGAKESVSLAVPADGTYRIVVNGYDVSTPSRFSIKISAIQGSSIAVSSPTGAVMPGQPATFGVEASPSGSGQEGVIFIGPRGAPTAMQVRVSS